MKIVVSVIGVVLVAALTHAAHECERTCEAGDTRTCYYTFNLQEYHTMSRACFNCPFNTTDCSRPECIAGDGVARPLITINRQLPGPSINVCEGDRVVVDVYNWMLSDTETIHFHGHHMKDFQYYDGVPFVTQCPILGGSFRYNFVTTNSGTLWWHSHSGLHRGSGVFGAFVVREVEDPMAWSYDVDLPEHVIIFNDWFHVSTPDKFFNRYLFTDDDFATNILVNGKGRLFEAQYEGEEEASTPVEVVKVTPGLRHRLRLINAGGLNCPTIVSVDNHQLNVIGTDGDPIEPYVADSIVLHSGERYDVVLEADQLVDNYWIRFNGLIDCTQNECVQGAVLRYDGAPEELPTVALEYDSNYPPGVVVNPLNSDGVAEEEVTMVELNSFEPSVLEEQVDKKFYLALNFNLVDNLLFFNPDLYSVNDVSDIWQAPTPQINNITFRFPLSPPLSQPSDPQPTVCFYDEESTCVGNFCACTYVFEVGLGETVEMVLVDEGTIGDENHPFHLHGYKFHVVAMQRLGSETTLEEVRALDAAGLITRRLENTVKKDTVTIPDGGYTVIRFTADNPGWWAMHCHLVFHSEMGMIGALHVGETSDLPPVPEGFPTCGSFMPDV
ncbi:hypothetical protein OTU49_009506 [Cherax quadricarinatus]|uniref:Uncharacterized protein n=1 Tax=Cherax quadricarinatus TaxID=27406 RepID=A0AAW0WKY1_CHEQU